jgi:hypothetical protein
VLGSSNPDRFRRIVAGLSLILFPLALVAEEFVDDGAQNSAQLYDVVATNPNSLIVQALLLIVSSVFLIPATVGIVHLVRRRGVTFVHVGAFFAILGALGHVAIATHNLLITGVSVSAKAEMVAFLDFVEEGGGAIGIVFPLVMSFGAGMVLLAIGAFRARLAPAWALGAVVAAVVINLAGPGSIHALDVTKQILGATAFVWIGVTILRMSDQRWGGAQTLAGLESVSSAIAGPTVAL